MRTKTIARRDMNEKPILAALRELGIWYRQQQPDAGFDILAAGRAGLRVIEIKNPDLPPSARQLTPNEVVTAAQLAAVGIDYAVCETLADVLADLGY